MIVRIAKDKIENHTHEDKFSFNERRKYKWLQRICLNILAKIGCHSDYSVTSTTYTSKEIQDAKEYIYAQYTQLCNRSVLNGESLVIYMGAREWGKFHDEEIHSVFAFRTQMELRRDNINRPMFLGMEIIILPYWEGILVAPRANSIRSYSIK